MSMLVRTLTVLSTASLIVAAACELVAAAEFATKEDAVAMVKEAVAFIKEKGPDKAYAEISSKTGHFHDRGSLHHRPRSRR